MPYPKNLKKFSCDSDDTDEDECNNKWKEMHYAYEKCGNGAYFKSHMYGKYRLCLQNIPSDMNKLALKNLCNNYGKVVNIFDSKSENIKFVSFESYRDMSNVLENFRLKRPFGIRAVMPNQKKEKLNNYNYNREKIQNLLYNTEEEKKSSEIDLTNRQYKGPFENHPLLETVEDKIFVTENDYLRTKLKEVDPTFNFLIESDMYYDERLFENEEEEKDKKNQDLFGRQVFAGRSYYKESRKLNEKLKLLSNSCENQYFPEENRFVKSCKEISLENLKYLKCAVCGSLSSKICENRSNFYCSNDCQAKYSEIFENLDNIFKLKDKNDLNNGINSINQKRSCITMAKFPANQSEIMITSIIKPNLFFIRSIKREDEVEYSKILNKIHNLSINAKSIRQLPQRGDILITNFKGSTYYRVLVLNPIDENNIVVIYIDFGNVEIKKLSELKETSQEITKYSCYTFSVFLKDVDYFEPTKKLRTYLNTLINNSNITLKLLYDDITLNKNHRKKVEIVDKTNNNKINKRITDLKVIVKPKEDEIPIMKWDIKFNKLPSAENIKVVVTDNSLIQMGIISCILPKYVISLQNFNSQIKDYAESTEQYYCPRNKEVCIVNYNSEQWIRGQCLEVVGDGNPTIEFIDYGNMSPINVNKIRIYPKDFKDFPCFTATCFINDMPKDINKEVATRLKELIPINKEIIIEKVEEFDDVANLIYLPKIIATLKEEKL